MEAAASLRRTRVELGISTRELAAIAGVARSTVEGIERGIVTAPRMRTQRAIALALDVPEGAISEFKAARERAAEGK